MDINKLVEKQFVPNLEDIENEELKRLSKRLKEKSYKKTLTKIVEWQEKNIVYWMERGYMHTILSILLIVSILFFPLSDNIKWILTPIIILTLFDFMSILPTILTLITYLIVLFTFIFSIDFTLANRLFPIQNLIVLSILFGGIISLLIYLIIRFRNIKLIKPEFKLGDTFKLSLSVDKILKYRFAICRDYAKLTMALLFNIYPKEKKYFITISGHVAGAIKVGNVIYVLDQRLPVRTFDNWLLFWKEKLGKKKLKAEIIEVNLIKNQLKTNKVDSKEISKVEIPKVNTEKIEKNLIKILKIKQSTKKDKPILEIPIKNLSLCYDNNEIVIWSLIEDLKNKIENEFCNDIKIISKINVTQEGKNIILRIY